MKFKIEVKEVHYTTHILEADCLLSAISKVEKGESDEKITYEYSHTLPILEWGFSFETEDSSGEKYWESIYLDEKEVIKIEEK